MSPPAFLTGGGDCGARMRALEWSDNPLGPPALWPGELKTLVGIMLGSAQPMFSAWGPDRVMLYNDGYAEIMGPARHPWGLGRDFDQVWADILPDVRPILDRAYAGLPTSMDDLQLAMTRNGRVEETHFSFSYTPVRTASGAVGGLFCACTETTTRVLAERRLAGESDRLREMFQQAPGFVAVLRGPDHVFGFANASYRTLIGRDDVVGRRVAEVLPEVVGRGFLALLDDVFSTGRTFVGREIELELLGPDGAPERRVVNFVYQPIHENGAVAGIFVEGFDVTAQTRAVEALADQAERLRLVQQAGGIGSFDWNINENQVHRSPEYLQVQGLPPDYPLDESHGDAWEARLHPQDRERVVASLGRSLASGGAFELEYRIIRPVDGRTAWLLNRGRVDLDSEGRAVRLISAQSDVTERKAAEAALRESEERLRLAQEAAEFGSFDWVVPDGRMEVSDAYRRILGVAPDVEITNDLLTALAHPDDRERLGTELDAIDRGADIQLSEVRILQLDGGVRWVQSRARTRFDGAGRAVRRTGVIQDVTSRREAEEALRDSEGRFRAAVRAVEGVVWTNTADGEMRGPQPGWTALTGQTEAEYEGYGWAAVVHPDDAEPTVAAWSRALATRSPFIFEHRVRVRDGRWRTFAVRAIPAFDVRGRILEWVGVHTDVTDRREVEAALRELNDTLEAHVENRTRDLEAAQEQLRQSQKMEAVGQLTGGIAHDFNNLLQGITGSLDLIRSRIAQGRAGELDRLIDGAMASADRAAALTHRLLAFSRRQPLDPKPVNANQLVGSMEDLLRRTLGERMTLELALDAELWTTLCDGNQLENALLNLAINARHAMPDGGRLTIATSNADVDDPYAARERDLSVGQYICIAVTDTGVGMPPEVVARAFDPFFTTKPAGQGTGLGLSMIYGFARQSEGYAKIASRVGQGTTVSLYLPRYRGRVDPDAPPAGVVSEQPARSGATVLVVEDEAVIRDLIVASLEELGYAVLEAGDGPAGLAVIHSDVRIDLLVTDIGLPGMNGRALADAARRERPELRVLFMTGYAENAALAAGFLQPGMAMITKPFALDVLRARTVEMIEA